LRRPASRRADERDGHQGVRIKIKGQFRFLALKQAQKLELVIAGLEYPLAIIPTRDQVEKPTSYFQFSPSLPRRQMSIFQA